MASMNSAPFILLIMVIISSYLPHLSSVSAFEFQVGDGEGWVIPPRNDTHFYNEWASKNRFLIGDSIRFSYRKDSVMEVTEEDYKHCTATRPYFFSNTGNTVFQLDRSGPFYYISGSTGHCQRGQRMIVRVMSDQPEDGPAPTTDTHKSSSGRVAVAVAPTLLLARLVLSCVASSLF
ncbi:hypothetical protein Ancab_002700 [Ancistrocladus abbreviatus]